MKLIIFHDNGVPGNDGYSDEDVQSDTEIPSIIESYKRSGIQVFGYLIEYENMI